MYFVWMFLLSCLTVCDMHPLDKEPMCTSKYDFEEKLLEKVIRMELVMEAMKTRVDSDLQTFRKDNEKLSLEYDNMRAVLSQSVNEMIKNYEQLDEKAGMKLTEIKEEAEKAVSAMQQEKGSSIKPDVVFHVKDVDSQPTANSIITFSTVVENTNDVYNQATGYFTAPRNGTYWFSAQMCSGTNKYIIPSIYIRDILISSTFIFLSNNGDCSTVNAVAILRINDTVCLKAGSKTHTSSVWSDSNYNSNNFMGALMN